MYGGNNKIDLWLLRSMFDREARFALKDIRATSQLLRADEFLWATVANSSTGFGLTGDLVLVRDERVRQPLPKVTAPTLDSAANLFARAIAQARVQLAPARRCENAMRDNNGPRAVATARLGIRLYPRAAIARTCLVRALRFTRAPATDVLTVADELLSIDAVNPMSWRLVRSLSTP